MVNLTIDGMPVEAEEGKTVLQVAKDLGIWIPTLCYNEILDPYASCRICLVEVTAGGRSRLEASCAAPVEEGVEVLTSSERVLESRRVVLELMLARWPHVKVLQELAETLGVEKSRFPTKEEKDECILCGQCVRVCSEVVGAHVLSFANRGIESVVMTPFERESEICLACGACAYVCPTNTITIKEPVEREVAHSELVLGPATPIHVTFRQAVPNVPVIDRESCVHFKTGACKICERFCEPEAINHEMEDQIEEIEVGAIIAATGFEAFDCSRMAAYGYGRLPNVLTSLEFERMNNAGSPTGGKILCENGKPAESIAILHCVGSRDENYNEYCSRVCCMYAMKFAHLAREKTGAQVYEFYIDIRAFGKGYEEFYKRMLEEDVTFIRGKGAEVTEVAETPEEEGKLIVKCEDTLLGVVRRIPVDMVVLGAGLEARRDAAEVAKQIGVNLSRDGFFMERHPKLAPIATVADGVFVAGACQGPKDIPDTVAQGLGAAGEALSMIDRGVVEIEPIASVIDEEHCGGCMICIGVCPFNAIDFNTEKRISVIEEVLCKGCGTCVAACPSGAATQRGFKDVQILAEVEGALAF